MNLLRASILDDRGRQVRLLPMCMLGRLWQRGEARVKFDIEAPVRMHRKSRMTAVGLAMSISVLLCVVMFFVIPIWARSQPSSMWSSLLPGLLWPVLMFGVWMPLQMGITARWASAELRNAYLGQRRCPCCLYNLADQPFDPEDKCCVCPECGAAWRVDVPAPPRPFPAPASLRDDRGHRVHTGMPLRRRAALAWAGAPARGRFDAAAAAVVLVVLAPLFGRFVGPYASDGLEALTGARWGRTISHAVSLFFVVVVGAAVLSLLLPLWRGFWRRYVPVAQRRRRRCAACGAALLSAAAEDGLIECGCGAAWRCADDPEAPIAAPP